MGDLSMATVMGLLAGAMAVAQVLAGIVARLIDRALPSKDDRTAAALETLVELARDGHVELVTLRQQHDPKDPATGIPSWFCRHSDGVVKDEHEKTRATIERLGEKLGA